MGKLNEIVKKMRPIDYMIIGVCIFILLILAFIYIGKKVYSPTPVLNEGKITYDILFRGVSITGDDARHNPFKVGDETFVTIRNQPHAKLKIIDVKYDRKRKMVPTGNANKPYVLVEDMENPCSYDFIVTVEDNAKFTEDGVVSADNKIKVGAKITLESTEYRLDGIISNFNVVDLKNNEDE